MSYIKLFLKWVFAIFFVFAGVMHFLNEAFYMKIMPDYIPQGLHLPAVYVSGVAEIALGVLLVVPQTTRLAAWGLIALLIAVFPANIYAFQHSEEIFGISQGVHFWRLPLQAVMIAWAWCYTRPDRTAATPTQTAPT